MSYRIDTKWASLYWAVCAISLNAFSETMASGICGGRLQNTRLHFSWHCFRVIPCPVRYSYKNLRQHSSATCQREARHSTKRRAEASQGVQCGKRALLRCNQPRRTGTRPMLPLRGSLLIGFCSSIAGCPQLQSQTTNSVITLEPIQTPAPGMLLVHDNFSENTN